MTRGALSALADATAALERLAAHADHVSRVVHLEHVHVFHPTATVLGLRRRAYSRERGDDRSCWPALRAAPAVAVTAREYDLVGGNPLHPLSLVRWRPRAAEGNA